MSLPTTQKAIVIQGPGVAKLVNDRPLPNLPDDYILVKTVAVGLNPTDWKHIDFLVKDAGPVVGCDYSGVVEAVGPAVTKPFKKGDRVCGVVHGSNAMQHDDGAFAEYIIAKADLQIKIPDNLSFEQAATIGVGVTTIGQALYQFLGLPLPTESAKDATPKSILIYGGSSATGILAIQYAKLSGYKVITTCSSRNNELVKSLGADEVVDYSDEECAAKIRELTNDSLRLVFDTIGVPNSIKICADALASSPSADMTLRYHSLLPLPQFPRSDVKTTSSLAYTAIGKDFSFGPNKIPAKPEDLEYAIKFWNISHDLIQSGKITVSPAQVGEGLEGVLDGLQALRTNKVSGKKLVYKI